MYDRYFFFLAIGIFSLDYSHPSSPSIVHNIYFFYCQLLCPIIVDKIFLHHCQLLLPAVRNTTGHFYLNGNWRIDFPRARKFAGTTFHYERKNNGGVGIFAPEILRALGPTTEPLFIVVSAMDQYWMRDSFYM